MPRWIAWLVLIAVLGGCSSSTVASSTSLPAAEESSAPPRLVAIHDAELSADGSTVTLTFIGSRPYQEDDPCTLEYAGRARVDGDQLAVAVETVDRVEQETPPVFECTAIGHERSVTVELEAPFTGTTLHDEAGYTWFVRRPAGLAEIGGLTGSWELMEEQSLPESRTGRWSRTYAAGARRLHFIQSFNGPAEVGSGGDADLQVVAVGGGDAVLHRHSETGSLLLVWQRGPHGFALEVNEAAMSVEELVALAETVTDPDAPFGYEPVVASGEAPPDLIVVAGPDEFTVPGYDYCWDNPETGDGICADSFGGEVPTRATVGTERVEIRWLREGTLSAWYRIDDACSAPLPVEPLGLGRWRLDMPPEPGTFRINLWGQAPHGDTMFAIAASTSVPGPPPAPIATIWWPDPDGEGSVGLQLERVVNGATASLEVAGIGADAVVLDLDYSLDNFVCLPELYGRAEIGDVTALGEVPWVITLRATSGPGSYVKVWEWPRDLTPDGHFSGVMEIVP